MIVIEAKVSWSMVYYSSDFLAIWIWHLQNSKMSKSTLFLVQNCEGCLVSCITWWYMIPNARRKFEAFLKFPEGFGHWGRSILVNGILYFRLFGHLVVFRKTFKTWFAGKRKKMSIAAPSKSCLELFLGPICVFPGLKLKKKSVLSGTGVSPWVT